MAYHKKLIMYFNHIAKDATCAPAFIICPVSEKDRCSYILHTREPRLLIEITNLSDIPKKHRKRIHDSLIERITVGGFINSSKRNYFFTIIDVYSEIKIPNGVDSFDYMVDKLYNIGSAAADYWVKHLNQETQRKIDSFSKN